MNIDDIFEEYLDSMKEKAEEDVDYSYTIEIMTKKSLPVLLAFSVELEIEDEKIEIIDLRGDSNGLAKSKAIECFCYEERLFEYKLQEDSGKTFKASLTIGEDLKINYKRDKKTGDFKLDGGEDFKASGTLDYSKKELFFELDSLTFGEEEFAFKEATLVIKNKDNAPEYGGSCTEILTMDEEKWSKFRMYMDVFLYW